MSIDKLKQFSSFGEACAAFAMEKPDVMVNYFEGNQADKKLALKIATELKKQGIKVWSYDDLLPGQQWQFELDKHANYCSHMISIVSEKSKKAEDFNIAMEKIMKKRSAKMETGKTRLFQILQAEGAWTEEKEKINLIAQMIDLVDANAEPEENLVVIDNINSLPAACPRCGGPVEDKYSPICSYCHRGVTHLRKIGSQAVVETTGLATKPKETEDSSPKKNPTLLDKLGLKKLFQPEE